MDMLSQLPVPAKIVLVIVFLAVITSAVKAILSKIRVNNRRFQTLVTLLYSTIQYLAVILGLVWVLNIAGVNVNTIFASVGIVALVVGFSAESLIADVITGLFMIFENQFNVGDVVEIDGYRGFVEKIGIRTISMRDAGDNLKIVNNSNIKDMINLSSDISRAICDIRISYKEDLLNVEKILDGLLDECLKKHQNIFLKKPNYLGVQDLGEMALVLRIAAEVDEKNIFEGRRILNRELYLGMEKNGISIPYSL